VAAGGGGDAGHAGRPVYKGVARGGTRHTPHLAFCLLACQLVPISRFRVLGVAIRIHILYVYE